MNAKRITLAILTATLAIGSAAIAESNQQTSEKTEMKKQTHCPVMGGKINKAEYVDVKGYRIYVCCPGCKGKIQADPDKYIEKMKADGVAPEKTPKKKETEE